MRIATAALRGRCRNAAALTRLKIPSPSHDSLSSKLEGSMVRRLATLPLSACAFQSGSGRCCSALRSREEGGGRPLETAQGSSSSCGRGGSHVTTLLGRLGTWSSASPATGGGCREGRTARGCLTDGETEARGVRSSPDSTDSPCGAGSGAQVVSLKSMLLVVMLYCVYNSILILTDDRSSHLTTYCILLPQSIKATRLSGKYPDASDVLLERWVLPRLLSLEP